MCAFIHYTIQSTLICEYEADSMQDGRRCIHDAYVPEVNNLHPDIWASLGWM